MVLLLVLYVRGSTDVRRMDDPRNRMLLALEMPRMRKRKRNDVPWIPTCKARSAIRRAAKEGNGKASRTIRVLG